MKKTGILRSGICLAVFCMLALHCANPFVPRITIITPDQPVIIEDAVPYSLPVEVSVPVPGCGATVYPVDTGTFLVTLTRLLDDVVIDGPTDVTTDLGDPVLDPETGTNTWTGAVDLAGFGDYELDFAIGNEMGAGANHHSFRLEQAVSAFPGQYPEMTISGLGQDPGNCFLPNPVMSIINNLIGGIYFYMQVPSGADILAATPPGLTVTLELPVLGDVDVVLTLDEVNNDILMDGPDDYIITLTGLAPPPLTGFDCVITGAADGAFDDIDPNDLDGVLRVEILDVSADPEGGGCVLSTPDPGCEMIVELDANP